MYIDASQVRNNKEVLQLFYNKNIDMLFRDRKYEFFSGDIGERIFRKMIMDSISFFENGVLYSDAMRSPNEVLKDNLKNDYSAFIDYVDTSLEGKAFDNYCHDSYDKAINCGMEIFNRINDKASNKYLSLRKKSNYMDV